MFLNAGILCNTAGGNRVPKKSVSELNGTHLYATY